MGWLRHGRPQWLLTIFWMLAVTATVVATASFKQQLQDHADALNRHSFDRVLLVQLKLTGRGQMTQTERPTGAVDQFLISQKDLAQLAQIPGIHAMQVYRQTTNAIKSGQMQAPTATVLIVPPGFLLEHQLGTSADDALLAQGCILADATQLQRWGFPSQARYDIHVGPDPVMQQFLAQLRQQVPNGYLDDGSYDSPLCATTLNLPQGLGQFMNVVFVPENHPGLQNRLSFPGPKLWLTLDAAAPRASTIQAIRHFLDHQATPVIPGGVFEVQTFEGSDLGGVNAGSLSAWLWRVQLGFALAVVGIITGWAFIQWAALRRELALRMSLGQRQVTRVLRTAKPWLGMFATGALGGAVLGVALAGMWHGGWASALLLGVFAIVVCAIGMVLYLLILWVAAQRQTSPAAVFASA